MSGEIRVFIEDACPINPSEVGFFWALFLGGETSELRGIQLYQQLGCRSSPRSGII
jgi:hypothetical protein